MADEEDQAEEEFVDYKGQIEDLKHEIEALKKSNKTLELKKRESDLSLNKIKTEINSLRSLDKLWKDAAKTVFLNVEDVKRVYEAQIDQMMAGWGAIAKTGERITRRSENLKDVREVIKTLQQRVVQQDDMISQLNGRIRLLTTELDDKTKKVERLSQGIEEEVERLTQPIRERLADAMMMVMKEKAARAQERREVADLWPADHLLPTVLMKYRSLTNQERVARIRRAKEQDASLALSLEIRHNMEESRAWEMKYDDYGRPFYQHNKTGEVSVDPPAILSYQPPEGRDELGNLTVEPDSDDPITNWQLHNDYKGEVFYKHRITGEVRLDAPLLYEKIPVGKTKEQNVAEAATIVLAFIAEKISKHIAIKKKRKAELEHPLTAEEKRKRDKQRRNNNQSAEEIAAEKAAELELSEVGEPLELSKYQYDIETVEMLAYDLVSSAGGGRTDDLDPEELRAQRRGFLLAQHVDSGSAGTAAATAATGYKMASSVRSFPEELFEGETMIETDLTDITIEKIRGIVEELAQKEENLEQLLTRTRNNLKDFSFLLMERMQEEDNKKMKALRELRIQQEKDRKAAEKTLLIEKRKKAEQEAAELTARLRVEEISSNTADATDGITSSSSKKNKPSSEKKGNDGDDDDEEGDEEEEEEILEAQRPTLESMKASAAEMGLELDLSSYDATNNAMHSAQSVDTEYKDDAVLPPDYNTEEEKEMDLLDSAPAPLTDEELRKELFGDRAALLFGDLAFSQEGKDIEADTSPETVNIAKQLSNYAMFCGFVNLTLEDYPMQVNNLYSLLQDEKEDTLPTESDDDWLTSHFFLTVNKQQLDAHIEAKSKAMNEQSGMLPTGPFDPEVQRFESRTTGSVNRSMDHGYTPLSRTAKEESNLYKQYSSWKTHQLYAQVVKQHIQQAAVQQVYAHRTKAFVDNDARLWRERTIRTAKVDLKLNDLKYTAVPGSVVEVDDTTLHFTFRLGKWIHEAPSQHASPFTINWFNHVVKSQTEINTLQLDSLQIELMEGSVEHVHRILIGHGNVSLSDCIGVNIGRCFVFEVPITNDSKEVLGVLSFSITAHVLYMEEAVSDDPQELRLLEALLPKGLPPNVNLHTRSEAATKMQEDHANNEFRLLVAELRGDNLTLSKQLTGDHRTVDMPPIDKNNLKNLPKFNRAALFLEKKVTVHHVYVQSVTKLVEERSVALLEQFKSKRDKLSKDLADGKMRQKKLFDSAEDVKKDVIRMTKTVVDLRKPNKEPSEPILDDLPPVPYIPSIPSVGGLDSRGKKKKALPNNDFKVLLESIEKGELDGKEAWPFAEANFFPSQAQQLKLSKASQVRNSILDAKRAQEEAGRQRILDVYQSERERWEKLEKKRLSELEKAKKDCRKVNIKYDSAVLKLERYEAETAGLESDLRAIGDLYVLQEKSIDRFKLIRVKQILEMKRQEQYIHSLKHRLLRALNARRYALEYPQTATTKLQFVEYTKRTEDALLVLQMEVFECKQLLVQEGIRLRHILNEEANLLRTELTRVNISIEVIKQRGCFDIILQRYKFDSTALLSDLEKLKLREAEKDDIGIETIDDWGERYTPTKTWANGDIIKCQRMIDLLLTKVKVTEGYSRSASDSQKMLVDCLCSQWGECYFTIRDSWSENADYHRAQQLLSDSIQFISHARQLLKQERNEYITRPQAQLIVHNHIRTEQISQALQTHEYETETIRHSSALILDETRRHLESYRIQTSERIDTLENSIIELSRECQKVREELLAQQHINDEKTKVLWAFIHTLQTAIQQMSAKMEMILEEREKIVIQAKLMADNTRHQLRIERRHCSNLLFIIHSQRGSVQYLKAVIRKLMNESKRIEQVAKEQKYALRREVWEHLFAFTRLSTDVDALFEFFASRLANLAGARYNLNDALSRNNAAIVLAALCKNPRPLIRRCAARALGGMGWNGFTEMRILLWDSMMHWKMYKAKVLAAEQKEFHAGLDEFAEAGKFDAILRVDGELEEFIPAGNLSLRNIIKQRRQWALRAARRVEGPHVQNQKLLNIRDNVLPSLLQLCVTEDELDWEIARNAALAVSIASFEPSNHLEMTENSLCIELILRMCAASDAEVQTHAAITIANLCHRDVDAQRLFGDKQTVPLLLGMLTHPVADVLEAATAALANLTCYSDRNCQQTISEGGVLQLVSVMTSAYSENLLDGDQNDEVQANAAEALANIARYSNSDSVKYFDAHCVDALVLMCASTNKQLKRNVSLVLGNIAQAEPLRHEVGVKGGVEALMLCTEDNDDTIVANALWALENLMWYPPNQERAGRFMSEVVVLLTAKAAPVQRHACELLGNLLYYSATNRVRFLESEGALETLLALVTSRQDAAVVEALLRALLSLSYLDVIALWLGEDGGYIPMFLAFITPPFYSRPALRYSLQILGNLCLHHLNRALIAQLQGIELLIPLHADSDPEVRQLSVQIITYLEDITPPEVLARARGGFTLERLVTLASNEDPLVRAVAAEAIGEELWQSKDKPQLQARAQELGAVDALLAIAANEEEELQSLLPALWSLRNVINGNVSGQTQLAHRDGLIVLVQVLRRGLNGQYEAEKQTEQVLEASLACLLAAIQGPHERNARRLVMVGLDALLAIVADDKDKNEAASDMITSSVRRTIQAAEGVHALVGSLLLLLGPFNYVVCRNCGRRQDLKGTSCLSCGHRLRVEIDAGLLQNRANNHKKSSGQLHVSQSAKELPSMPWRHASKAAPPYQLQQDAEGDDNNELQQQQIRMSKTAPAMQQQVNSKVIPQMLQGNKRSSSMNNTIAPGGSGS